MDGIEVLPEEQNKRPIVFLHEAHYARKPLATYVDSHAGNGQK